MNWPGLQGRAPIMRALFRLPRGERSDLSRDGDNSGLEENQEVEAHLINNVGQTGEGALGHQQHVNRRNTNSSGGVEETERERIRRGSSTWRNDLEEGGGGLEARSRESSDAGRTHILGRNSGGSTGQLGIDENGDEHLNVTIDPVEFLKDVFTCLLLLSANIFVRHYMEIMWVLSTSRNHPPHHLFHFVLCGLGLGLGVVVHEIEFLFFIIIVFFFNYRSQPLRICNFFVISSGPKVAWPCGSTD
eukprot:342258_1